MRIDCHMHTCLSDGTLEPAALLALVRQQRLAAWAITDHDSCSAWRQLGAQEGLIPGVEITAGDGAREIHVVGLGIDPDHPQLDALLSEIRAIRHDRFARLVAHAAAWYGQSLTVEEARDPRSDSPSRVHLARALKARGCIGYLQQAFRDCLGDEHLTGLDLPTFPDLAAVRAVIQASGGVAILAHPGVHGSIDRIHQLMTTGGLDGLEVNHPHLDPLLRDGLLALAERHGWLRSCGSDFHWPGRRELGSWRLSRAVATPLLERVGWHDPLGQVAVPA